MYAYDLLVLQIATLNGATYLGWWHYKPNDIWHDEMLHSLSIARQCGSDL